jgi:hypothetical protein
MHERNWLPPESDRFHGSKKKTMTERGSLSYDASAARRESAGGFVRRAWVQAQEILP